MSAICINRKLLVFDFQGLTYYITSECNKINSHNLVGFETKKLEVTANA